MSCFELWGEKLGVGEKMFPRQFSKVFVVAVFVLGAVASSGQEYDIDVDVDGSGDLIIKVRQKSLLLF